MKKPPIIWTNILVLFLTPAAALIFVPLYGFTIGYDLFEWSMFILFMAATGLSITAGYHRLWSHRAYDAHWLPRLFFAIFGACGLQNSILIWCADHRRHHKYVDRNERDPYSANRGFWFSHIGWILREYDSSDPSLDNTKDLARDPIVRWQHRYYLPLAIFTNTVLLLAIGILHGKWLGVFLLAGLLRIVLNHHFTFFINSLAHRWGAQNFCTKNTSRDNHLLAFFTYGEGYHNFHHRFQYDYRNGVKWWHFDPGKWLIRTGSWLKLTRNLKKSNKLQIERARMAVQLDRALRRMEKIGDADHWRHKLEEGYHQCLAAMDAWIKFRQDWLAAKGRHMKERWDGILLRERYLNLKYNLKLQRQRWRLLTQPWM